jgi:predicted nucleotidyltransferase
VYESKSIEFLKENKIKKEVINTVEELLVKYKSIISIILIGSTSRNMNTSDSDLDFFIISSRKIKSIKIKNKIDKKFDFILKTQKEFKQDYEKNNELIIWSLKYGLALYNEKFLNPFRNVLKLDNFKPILMYKKEQINKYIEYLIEYKKILNDDGLAYYFEKIFYFLLRYYLYKKGFIPKSKHELYKQVLKHHLEDNLLVEIRNKLVHSNLQKEEMYHMLKIIKEKIN